MGIFGSDLQLVLRDLEDVDMSGERCQPGGGVYFDIREIRDLYEGGQGTGPDGAIRGIVISDRTTNNTPSQNLFVQDASGGIVVRFASAHSFDLGDEIAVDVSQQELSEFNGLMQVNNVPLANAEVLGQQPLPDPRVATVNDILVNAAAWESTRVKVEKVTIGGGTTFSGSLTVTDATGGMIMFTRSAATFASQNIPQGEVDIVALLSDFNAPQLVINSPSDITGGSGGGGDLDESFTSISNNTDINLQGWVNVALQGTRVWRAQVFDGNHYAQATAFNDAAADMETWLITPPIDVSKPKWLSFVTAQAFWVHDGLSIFTSTDFDGSDIASATWEPLSVPIAGSSDPDHDWIPSGDVDLEGFSEPVYIAFRYIGSGPGGQTTSYRVDDIKVREK
jgi:hypothetical protein